MLADRIDFMDIRATGQKQPGDLLLVFQGDALCRGYQKCRTAAGHKAKHQIPLAGIFYQCQDLFGTVNAALIGYRMAGFMDPHMRQR